MKARRFSFAVAVLAALPLSACRDERAPGITVHLGTDLPVSAFDTVALSGRSDGRDSRSHVVPWVADATFEVLDPGGDHVEITVALLDGTQSVAAARRGIDHFDQPHAWMFLPASCDTNCPEGQVCGRCGCENFALPTSDDDTAAPWEDACPEDPPPPGPPPPSEDRDAGTSDAREPNNDAGIPPPMGPDYDGGIADSGVISPPACPAGSSSANRSYRAGSYRNLRIGAQQIFALPPPMTVELWARFTGPPEWTTILDADNPNGEWRLSFDGHPARLSFELIQGQQQILSSCSVWPNDTQWHHIALQSKLDEGSIAISLYVDGVRCSHNDVSQAWSIYQTELEIPSDNEDPGLLIDALHIHRSQDYDEVFTPSRTPELRDTTVGLWQMDEEDSSTVAHDSLCQNDATVAANSFSDDFPR